MTERRAAATATAIGEDPELANILVHFNDITKK